MTYSTRWSNSLAISGWKARVYMFFGFMGIRCATIRTPKTTGSATSTALTHTFNQRDIQGSRRDMRGKGNRRTQGINGKERERRNISGSNCLTTTLDQLGLIWTWVGTLHKRQIECTSDQKSFHSFWQIGKLTLHWGTTKSLKIYQYFKIHNTPNWLKL